MTTYSDKARALGKEIISILSASPETIATAESLTGGLISATLTEIPGSSACVNGGICTYATSSKAALLGVEEELLERKGPVDPDVAAQMAENVREIFHTDWSIAVTGVAGPSQQNGHPVGEVYIAIANETQVWVEQHHFKGERFEIRWQTVKIALETLKHHLTGDI